MSKRAKFEESKNGHDAAAVLSWGPSEFDDFLSTSTYDSRVKLATKVGRTFQGDKQLEQFVETVLKRPEPATRDVDDFCEVLPPAKHSAAEFDRVGFALQAAVASKSLLHILKRELPFCPSLSRMLAVAIVKQEQRDEEIKALIFSSSMRVRNLLVSCCVSNKRGSVLEACIEPFLELDALDVVARYLHACSPAIVEKYLVQQRFAEHRQIRWHQLVKKNGQLILSMLKADLVEKFQSRRSVWSTWHSRLSTKADGSALSRVFMSQFYGEVFTLCVEHPCYSWTSGKEASTDKELLASNAALFLPSPVVCHCAFLLKRSPVAVIETFRASIRVHARQFRSMIPAQFWIHTQLVDFKDVLSLIKKELDCLAEAKMYYRMHSTIRKRSLLVKNESTKNIHTYIDFVLKYLAEAAFWTTSPTIEENDLASYDDDTELPVKTSITKCAKTLNGLLELVQARCVVAAERHLHVFRAGKKALAKVARDGGGDPTPPPESVELKWTPEMTSMRNAAKKITDFYCDVLLARYRKVQEELTPVDVLRSMRTDRLNLIVRPSRNSDIDQLRAQFAADHGLVLLDKFFVPLLGDTDVQKLKDLDWLISLADELSHCQIGSGTIWPCVPNTLRRVYSFLFDRVKANFVDNVIKLFGCVNKCADTCPDVLLEFAQSFAQKPVLEHFANENFSFITQLLSCVFKLTHRDKALSVSDTVISTLESFGTLSEKQLERLQQYKRFTPAHLSALKKATNANNPSQRLSIYTQMADHLHHVCDSDVFNKTAKYLFERTQKEAWEIRLDVFKSLYRSGQIRVCRHVEDLQRASYLVNPGSWDIWFSVLQCILESDEAQTEDISSITKFLQNLSSLAIRMHAYDPTNPMSNSTCSSLLDFAVELQWRLAVFSKGDRLAAQEFVMKLSEELHFTPSFEKSSLSGAMYKTSFTDYQMLPSKHIVLFVNQVLDAYESRVSEQAEFLRKIELDEDDTCPTSPRVLPLLKIAGFQFWNKIDRLREVVSTAFRILTEECERHEGSLVVADGQRQRCIALIQAVFDLYNGLPAPFCHAWQTETVLVDFINEMVRSRIGREYLPRWVSMMKPMSLYSKYVDGKSRVCRYASRARMVGALLSMSQSAIHIKFVWQYLLRRDQPRLAPFIAPELPFFGPYYPNKRSYRSRHGVAPWEWQDKLLRDIRSRKADEGQTDFEELFMLPASYGLHRMSASLCEKFGKQLLAAAYNRSSNTKRRTSAAIKYTNLPTASTGDLLKLIKDHADAWGKAMPVTVTKAFVRGLVSADDQVSAMSFLLSKKFLSSQHAAAGLYAISRLVNVLPESVWASFLTNLLQNHRKLDLKISFVKEVVRLLGTRPILRHMKAIRNCWFHLSPHRDVKVVILQSAISTFLSSSSAQVVEMGWEILQSAMEQALSPEVYTVLLAAKRSTPKSEAFRSFNHSLVKNVSGQLQKDTIVQHFTSQTASKVTVPQAQCERFANDVVVPLTEYKASSDVRALSRAVVIDWIFPSNVERAAQMAFNTLVDLSPDRVCHNNPVMQNLLSARWNDALRHLAIHCRLQFFEYGDTRATLADRTLFATVVQRLADTVMKAPVDLDHLQYRLALKARVEQVFFTLPSNIHRPYVKDYSHECELSILAPLTTLPSSAVLLSMMERDFVHICSSGLDMSVEGDFKQRRLAFVAKNKTVMDKWLGQVGLTRNATLWKCAEQTITTHLRTLQSSAIVFEIYLELVTYLLSLLRKRVTDHVHDTVSQLLRAIVVGQVERYATGAGGSRLEGVMWIFEHLFLSQHKFHSGMRRLTPQSAAKLFTSTVVSCNGEFCEVQSINHRSDMCKGTSMLVKHVFHVCVKHQHDPWVRNLIQALVAGDRSSKIEYFLFAGIAPEDIIKAAVGSWLPEIPDDPVCHARAISSTCLAVVRQMEAFGTTTRYDLERQTWALDDKGDTIKLLARVVETGPKSLLFTAAGSNPSPAFAIMHMRVSADLLSAFPYLLLSSDPFYPTVAMNFFHQCVALSTLHSSMPTTYVSTLSAAIRLWNANVADGLAVTPLAPLIERFAPHLYGASLTLPTSAYYGKEDIDLVSYQHIVEITALEGVCKLGQMTRVVQETGDNRDKKSQKKSLGPSKRVWNTESRKLLTAFLLKCINPEVVDAVVAIQID